MSIVALPLTYPSFVPSLRPSTAEAPAALPGRALPRVEWVQRQGALLHPSPMGENGDVLGLNLMQGCIHRCPFCPTHVQASHSRDDVVYAFAGTAERLAAEPASWRRRPRAVFVSPSTDPFPPLAAIQEETARVIDVLANHGVEAWLMTRGLIRPVAQAMLAAHRERVKVTVALTTLDRSLQRLLEPLTAPPQLRLKQIERLRKAGIPVQAALEPLIPGLTDTRANLSAVLEALAAVGVRHITASYLFLRPSITDNLVRALEPHGWDQLVLQAFAGGPMLSANGVPGARYLPKTRRQHGYAALMALAAGLGIGVSVCRTSNPDFPTPRRATAPSSPRQTLLQQFVEGGRQLRLA
jgi:DNA repair photolyase